MIMKEYNWREIIFGSFSLPSLFEVLKLNVVFLQPLFTYFKESLKKVIEF